MTDEAGVLKRDDHAKQSDDACARVGVYFPANEMVPKVELVRFN